MSNLSNLSNLFAPHTRVRARARAAHNSDNRQNPPTALARAAESGARTRALFADLAPEGWTGWTGWPNCMFYSCFVCPTFFFFLKRGWTGWTVSRRARSNSSRLDEFETYRPKEPTHGSLLQTRNKFRI